MGMRILEGTITLILVSLIVRNAPGFSQAVQAVGGTYVDAVRALQGN